MGGSMGGCAEHSDVRGLRGIQGWVGWCSAAGGGAGARAGQQGSTARPPNTFCWKKTRPRPLLSRCCSPPLAPHLPPPALHLLVTMPARPGSSAHLPLLPAFAPEGVAPGPAHQPHRTSPRGGSPEGVRVCDHSEEQHAARPDVSLLQQAQQAQQAGVAVGQPRCGTALRRTRCPPPACRHSRRSGRSSSRACLT